MQSGDGFRGIEQGAPGECEREQGEQYAEVRPGVRVRVRQPATEPQRPDSHVEQRDHDRGRAHRHQRKLSQPLGPGQSSQVIAQVLLQHGVRDAEGRWARRERRRHPPIPGAEREQEPEHDTARDRAREQQGLRHRLDDLQVAEPTRQLHGADRAVDEQEIRRAPGDRADEQQPRHQPGEVPGREVRGAAGQARPPRALGGLEGEPAPAHEPRNQESDSDEQGPAADDGLHAPGL